MAVTGLHEDLTRRHELAGSSDRSFGLLAAGLLLLLGAWPWFWGGRFRVWALVVGAAVLGLALVWPRALHPLNLLLTRLSLWIGRFTNPVILGALYYLVFAPLGVLLRLVGQDSLKLRRDPGAGSYWLRRQPPGPPPPSMAQQF